MRPIIGLNDDCLWLCGDVCHSPPSLSAPRSHGKLRRRLTGTGVEGQTFVLCSDTKDPPRPPRAPILVFMAARKACAQMGGMEVI